MQADRRRRQWVLALAGAVLGPVAGPALAQATASPPDAMEALRAFVAQHKTGRAQFTQVVHGPDGVARRRSEGEFEFARPGRFRFEYRKPFPQLIVADGQRLWVYDPDLQQVVSRRQASALAATPAALLAGGRLEQDFLLSAEGSSEGLDWVKAVPRQKDAPFEQLRVGFRGRDLSRLELLDALGQRSVFHFSQLQWDLPLPADRFQFQVPKGVDHIAS